MRDLLFCPEVGADVPGACRARYRLRKLFAKTMMKPRDTSVNASVFQLISSTKPLTTCAAVSAKTLARPTALGSRCMHSSHALQVSSMCGIRCDGSHRLFRYCCEQCAISRRILAEYSAIRSSTSRWIVRKATTRP